MENQDQHERGCLGQGHSPACGACQDGDRCNISKWLKESGFKKPYDHLFEPYFDAVEVAYSKYPDRTFTHRYDPSRCTADGPLDCRTCPDLNWCADPRGVKKKPLDNEQLAKKRESHVVSQLKKVNEEWSRELARESRELRKQADRKEDEAQAARRANPKGKRFPPGWMLDAAKTYRGAKVLMHLMMIVKETATMKKSTRLIDELVASGRCSRQDLMHRTYNNGVERSWPLALFQMDYDLALRARGWLKDKTRRLLRKASDADVFWSLGKLPAENGQMVYCAGYWLMGDDGSWIIWRYKEKNGGPEVFKEFTCT